jgi:hypothetical protein
MARQSQQELEERLNLILLEMANLQNSMGEALKDLKRSEKLNSETERYILCVTNEIMSWIDECTLVIESSPILLRRMEVHLERLKRLLNFVEDISGS